MNLSTQIVHCTVDQENHSKRFDVRVQLAMSTEDILPIIVPLQQDQSPDDQQQELDTVVDAAITKAVMRAIRRVVATGDAERPKKSPGRPRKTEKPNPQEEKTTSVSEEEAKDAFVVRQLCTRHLGLNWKQDDSKAKLVTDFWNNARARGIQFRNELGSVTPELAEAFEQEVVRKCG